MKHLLWTAISLPFLASVLTSAPARNEQEQAEAEVILNKAIKAVGGKEKLASFTSFVEKAKRKSKSNKGRDVEYATTISCQLPDRWCVQMEGTNGAEEAFVRHYIMVDDQGWALRRANVREMRKEEAVSLREAFKDELMVWQLLFFKEKDHKLSPIGEAKVGDRTTVGVKVTRKGKPDLRLYFDRDTDLLLKLEYDDVRQAPPGETPPPPVRIEVLYEDYRQLDGIKYPAKKTTLRDREPYCAEEILELRIVDKFDEKTFAKPE